MNIISIPSPLIPFSGAPARSLKRFPIKKRRSTCRLRIRIPGIIPTAHRSLRSLCWERFGPDFVKKLQKKVNRAFDVTRISSRLFEIFDSFLCSFVDLRLGFISSITLWGPPTILDRFPEANASCSKKVSNTSYAFWSKMRLPLGTDQESSVDPIK